MRIRTDTHWGGDPGESEPVVREDQDTQDHWEDSSTQTPKGRPASVGGASPRTPREDQGSNFSTPVRRTCAGRVVVRPSMYRDFEMGEGNSLG